MSSNILQLLKRKLETVVVDQNLQISNEEETFCNQLLETIDQMKGERNISFEVLNDLVDNELEFDEQDHEPIYEPEENENRELNFLSFDYMQNVVNYMKENSGHSAKTIMTRFRLIKYEKLVNRIWNYMEKNGTKRQKLFDVTKHCYAMFKEARDAKSPVHDSDIRRWALHRAEEIGLLNFVASPVWVNRFKRKYRISSRKICKFTSFRKEVEREEIENQAIEFLLKFQDDYANFPRDKIFNSDQCGFRYTEMGNRTLSHTGEKKTAVAIRPNLSTMTHSYSIQPTISMTGKMKTPLFIVLKEKGGQFGPRVMEIYRISLI